MHEENVTGAVLVQYLIIDMVERLNIGKAEPFHLKWFMSGGDVIVPSIMKVSSLWTSLYVTIIHVC